MSLATVLGLVALAGAVVALVSWWLLRRSGAMPGLGRRLAGPPEVNVGRLLDAGELPGRPVRVSGRIRCAEPLVADDDERLVCFHRDVEVEAGGRWRTVERLRETRSFDLWAHDGSLSLDPALAAEPLVSIPKIWRGDAGQLEEPHASAAQRVAERHGTVTAARSTVRTIGLTDRLLVLARPVRGNDGRVRLEPPDGGFVITNLALPDAMRVLGGRRRRLAAGSVIGLGVGIALAACAGVAAVAALVLSG